MEQFELENKAEITGSTELTSLGISSIKILHHMAELEDI